MRQYAYLQLFLVIPALTLILTVVPGCPDKPAKDGGQAKDGGKDGGSGDKLGSKKSDPLTAKTYDGVIKGKVVYDGTSPVMKELTAVDGHEDKAKCHEGSTKDPTWIVNKDNGVADVIVYLEAPAGKFFALDEKQAKSYTNEPWIDQPFCLYEPQTVAIFAQYKTEDGKGHDTGNKFTIKNSAKVSHNTKIKGDGKANETESHNLSAGDTKGVQQKIKFQRDLLPISCDKHSWMTGTLKTFEHPFFAVTGKDGTFEIKNVPVGVEVTVKTWHKDAADMSKTETFKAGDNSVELKVKAKS